MKKMYAREEVDYIIEQEITGKQDKLSNEQLENIDAVPNKLDKPEVEGQPGQILVKTPESQE